MLWNPDCHLYNLGLIPIEQNWIYTCVNIHRLAGWGLNPEPSRTSTMSVSLALVSYTYHKAHEAWAVRSYSPHCNITSPAPSRGSNAGEREGYPHQCCEDSGQDGREFLDEEGAKQGVGLMAIFTTRSRPPHSPTQRPNRGKAQCSRLYAGST